MSDEVSVKPDAALLHESKNHAASEQDIVILGEDFRFLDLGLELLALKDYATLVERELPVLAESARDRLFDDWLGPNADEQEIDWAQSAVTVFTEYELPRMLRSPILVQLWAIYESAANRVAHTLRERGNHSLTLRDINGRNDLDKLEKYFEHVLHFPLFNDEETRNHLEMLRVLRNAISHSNGRIDDAFKERKKDDWRKIRNWAAADPGISLDVGYLDLSAEFVQRVLEKVGTSMDNLIDRALKAVKE